MALSDRLTDLAGRAKRFEEAAATTREQNREKLEEQRERLHASIAAQAQKLSTGAAQASDQAHAWWTETTAQIEARRAELEARRKADTEHLQVETAKEIATDEEDFAVVLADLAAFAMDVAQEAAEEAAASRTKADELTAGKTAVAH